MMPPLLSPPLCFFIDFSITSLSLLLMIRFHYFDADTFTIDFAAPCCLPLADAFATLSLMRFHAFML